MSDDQAADAQLRQEIQRRRTFAIISHPDAGKTTLTEKLLLYSGMLRTAGMVGARKGKGASSDWMGMEQERGISITASAMQFPYKDAIINVLDTPGHQDFSEDTYRTLTAADSVIMVVDAAKGVEEQTRKLFQACRKRGIPILTFVNKMDMPARDPLDLMAEVEDVLGIQAAARNWPIGSGREFQGVIDRDSQEMLLFTKTGKAGSTIPDCERVPLAAAAQHERIGPEMAAQLQDEMELLEAAGNPFSMDSYLAGDITPVYFGSALINYGVEPLFDSFVAIAPCPGPRRIFNEQDEEEELSPTAPFSAFVFKLQANMNPKHRDCIAFMRINSGHFERGIMVRHQRTGKKFAMPSPHTLIVNERNTAVEAWPGDVIGVINKGEYAIGDTISAKGTFRFEPPPSFMPELFARVKPTDLGKQKAFNKGLQQLVSEGTVQLLHEWHNSGARPILAAVGQLQFEVLGYRFQDEYNVSIDLDMLPYGVGAWLIGDVDTFKSPHGSLFVGDQQERPMVLFSNSWNKDYAARENPEHELLDFG